MAGNLVLVAHIAQLQQQPNQPYPNSLNTQKYQPEITPKPPDTWPESLTHKRAMFLKSVWVGGSLKYQPKSRTNSR